MRKFLLVYTLALTSLSRGAAAIIQLTSNPPHVSGTFCRPGPVTFTCEGIMTSSSLFWFLDGRTVAVYGFLNGCSFPVDLPLSLPLDGVTATVINATANPDLLSYSITSILNVSNVSILNGTLLQCRGATSISIPSISINIGDLLSPSLMTNTHCSLLPSSGGAKISLQWSPSFTSQYAVERYRVSVNPDPSSCSSDQVSPSEDYSCSGLVMGTLYTFTVSAINCGDQEGESVALLFRLQAPKIPVRTMLHPVYDEGSLIKVIVEWIQTSEIYTGSKSCDCDDALNYTVIVENSTDVVFEQNVNLLDSCSESTCFVSLSSSFFSCDVSTHYTTSIVATNIFGSSKTAVVNTISYPRLTAINRVLLALGVVACCFAVVLIVVHSVISKLLKYIETTFSRLLLVVGGVLTVESGLMWLAVAFQVGLQKNTCDIIWQSTRDNLIITAHVFSDMALMTAVLCAVSICSLSKAPDRDGLHAPVQSEQTHTVQQANDHEIMEMKKNEVYGCGLAVELKEDYNEDGKVSIGPSKQEAAEYA